MLAFGVGCFHFGIRSSMPSPFSPDEYGAQIRAALSALDVVSDINIHVDEATDPAEKTLSHDGKLPAFSDGCGWFPYVSFLDISFHLHLPRRVQARLLDTPEQALAGASEEFQVDMRYCYHAPVAFIEWVDASAEADPSNAVVVVRKYLEANVGTQAGHIIFEMIGPSPFHAQFRLSSGSDGTGIATPPFDVQHIPKRGYDEIAFTFSTDVFSSESHAKEALFQTISDDLALYYSIVLQEHAHWRLWTKINEISEQLFPHEDERGAIRKLKSKLMRGGKLRRLADYICRLRSDLLFDENLLREAYENTFSAGGYLRQHVDSEMSNRTKFPLQEVTDLLNFGEQRHSKALEMGMVLVAAIVGGIVGSFLTFNVTTSESSRPSLSQPPPQHQTIDGKAETEDRPVSPKAVPSASPEEPSS